VDGSGIEWDAASWIAGKDNANCRVALPQAPSALGNAFTGYRR
jgi:hypothetical protein